LSIFSRAVAEVVAVGVYGPEVRAVMSYERVVEVVAVRLLSGNESK
jgi:hypothetical protein